MKQMKKNRIISLLVLTSILTFVLQSCGVISTYSTFESQGKKSYYSDTTNYIEAEGYIKSYHYNKESKAYYFVLQSDWLPQKEAGDPNFKIIGNGALILKENNVENELAPNSFIKFLYAPKYFGDGYVRPIVSLTVNDKILLTFDDGYQGLIEAL